MYDLLIRGACVVDGTGAPSRTGDVGVLKDRIVSIGTGQIDDEAYQVIDAHGLVVAPGFIDAHTHDDLAVLRRAIVPPKVQQGITTVVIGNCGFSMAPVIPTHVEAMKEYSAAVLGSDEQPWNWSTMGAFLETLSAIPLGQNVRALLGHTALRVAVMGFEQREATEQEIIKQQDLVAEAMQAGAAGLSLGLMYVPGLYTPTRELVRIAQTISKHNGVVTAHMRGEGDHLLSSVAEMISLAEKANAAVHISHLKVTGRKNWGTIQHTLERIEDARASGLDITVDVYPYTAGSTTMTQLLPPWIQEGGIARMLERLREPAIQQQVLKDFAQGVAGWENQVGAIGWGNVYIAGVQYERYKSLEGLNLVEASNTLGLTPEQAFFHLLLEEQGQITVTLFMMDERDVDQVVRSSFSMLGSDGLPIVSGRPHPRLYGTFPRFIQRYVREQKSLQLEEAIRKVTAFPAQRFRMHEQGVIEVGKKADLVIFDPDTISERATYAHPRVYPEGISAVIVAGKPVILHGQQQDQWPGEVIRI